jgi:hypothetical protein
MTNKIKYPEYDDSILSLVSRLSGFIGDYLAVAVGRTNLENKPSKMPLKASHARAYGRKMMVPLL